MKDINLEQVEEFKDFDSPVGGFVCGILDVEDLEDKECLKITYDIAEGDFKNFYSKRKKEMKWDCPALYRSYKEGVALKFFKGYITALEKSNKNYKFSSNEQTMKLKKIGLVLAEEEYINKKGEKKVRTYVASVHSIDAIRDGDFKVPELKTLAGASESTKSGNFSNPFVKNEKAVTDDTIAEEIDDDDIPF